LSGGTAAAGWSQPIVLLDPGDVTVDMPGGTKVKVQDKPA
jgi:hypothetical protein